MEKSPGVTVDNNGNITLKGKQGVIILIDNKPAYLSGDNLRDPFYLMRFKGTTDLDKGVANINSLWDNRRVIVTFNYRFGKTAEQQQRKRGSAADEEKSRINTSNN